MPFSANALTRRNVVYCASAAQAKVPATSAVAAALSMRLSIRAFILKVSSLLR